MSESKQIKDNVSRYTIRGEISWYKWHEETHTYASAISKPDMDGRT